MLTKWRRRGRRRRTVVSQFEQLYSSLRCFWICCRFILQKKGDLTWKAGKS